MQCRGHRLGLRLPNLQLVPVWSASTGQGNCPQPLEFRLSASARAVVGVLLVAFALVVYPAWSFLSGHRHPETPSFGLPCPTTIFTVGLLSFLVRPYPRSPLAVPVLWSLVGVQAAFPLGVPQDLGLAVAAVVGIVLMVRSRSPAALAGMAP